MIAYNSAMAHFCLNPISRPHLRQPIHIFMRTRKVLRMAFSLPALVTTMSQILISNGIPKPMSVKLQLDNSLLCYLYTPFGHTVNFCTECKRDIYTFRCHPSYGSAGPIFDWMIIKFNTGLFPCRLAAVVLDHSAPDNAVQLVVQSTTSRTPVKSTLFQEWNWSAENITISPNTIEAPCFCDFYKR